MMLRRADDRDLTLVLAGPADWEAESGRAGRREEAAWDLRAPAGRASSPSPLLFIAEVSRDDTMRVTPARETVREDTRVVAGAAAAAWREEALRMRKRRELPDKLLAFFAELNHVERAEDVHRAVVHHAVRIVGAFRAFILLPQMHDPHTLEAVAGTGGPVGGIRVSRFDRFDRAGLICASEVRRSEDTGMRSLSALVTDEAVSMIAHVPLAGGGVMVLTERRDDRVFEAEDWDILQAMVLLGEMSLERVRLLDSVRSLALTDPLTGLANRRHMDVVMRHAWAASQRGDSLTVIVLDLDDFKSVNDTEGHLAGDALLREVADALLLESRGADTVVRYGGDEFLVILPRGTVAGAEALMRRVRARLMGRVELSEGIAARNASHRTAEDLIRDADRRLYEMKNARRTTASGAA